MVRFLHAAFAIGSFLLAAVTAGADAMPPGPASSTEHEARCADKDGWSDPAPPLRIFGNVYDVGTCGIVVLLVSGSQGAMVIDGAAADAASSVIANIERLGFRLSDVKLLLSSHEHLDHAGGLSELQRRTGATMVATAASAASLQTGVMAADDPQKDGDHPSFRGVRVGRLVRDGEVVHLGSLKLTAHTTPGHAPGSTSWSWRSCEGLLCHDVVYADSLSAVSADRYRFSGHPAYVATFKASIAKIANLPCDLIVTPHPAASDLYGRLSKGSKLTGAEACMAYAKASLARLEARLAGETAAKE